LTFKPTRVLANGVGLREVKSLRDEPAWSFDAALNVVRVRHSARNVEILGRN
jgi:hypothetical protein